MLLPREKRTIFLGIMATILVATPDRASSSDARTGLYVFLQDGGRMTAEVSIDEQKVCLVALTPEDAPHSVDEAELVCELDISRNARWLRIKGEIAIGKKRKRLDMRREILDLAPHTSSLWNRERPLEERLQSFVEVVRELDQLYPDALYVPIELELRREGVDTSFASAEARLGLELPDVLRTLAAVRIELGDSSFLPPEDWKSVSDFYRGEYTDDVYRAVLSDLSTEVSARYARSVMVFLEVSDGVGGMAWDPEGGWFRFHEGYPLGSPQDLLDRRQQPLGDADALLSVINQRAIGSLADDLVEAGAFGVIPSEEMLDGYADKGYLVIDSAHPEGMLRLDVQIGGRRQILAYLDSSGSWMF
ncbi:MAG: hypothetical protein MPN21_25290 [Thermoanaerobaculia bacterium]|nr:hypothetical protein [Thermoanaerobaculia bacterium]